MAWLALVAAGILEVVWASLLPETKGFSRFVPTVVFLVALAASMAGLAYAPRTLPIGTAYAVWVGIGAVGTVLLGIAVKGDKATLASLLSIAALIGSIVAVKVTAPH